MRKIIVTAEDFLAYRGATRLDVPGARSKFGAPMFEPEVFRKQIYCVKDSTCDIVGAFRRPIVIRRPGNFAPLTPLLVYENGVFGSKTQVFLCVAKKPQTIGQDEILRRNSDNSTTLGFVFWLISSA